MVRMSDVWDHTTQVLSGRGSAMARIAFLGVFLPTVVSAAFKAYMSGPQASPATQGLIGLVSIAIAVVLIWARLALIALSSDPAMTPAAASSTATRRLGPAIGVVLVVGLVFIAVLIPPVVVAFALGTATNFSPALLQSGVMPNIPPGAALFIALYVLALLAVIIFVSARLILVSAVIVNERLGLGAIRRSFALTRGSTWRIVGVILLYGIVALVATAAVQAIVGIVFALILGRVATVAFISAIAVAAVTTALTVVAAAFVAQLYVALRGPSSVGIAQTFE